MSLEHPMFHFATQNLGRYSDMNGFGHLTVPFKWFSVYWGGLAGLFLLISQLFFIRGNESGFKKRLQLAGQRWGRPTTLIAIGFGLIFTLSGSYIFYKCSK